MTNTGILVLACTMALAGCDARAPRRPATEPTPEPQDIGFPGRLCQQSRGPHRNMQCASVKIADGELRADCSSGCFRELIIPKGACTEPEFKKLVCPRESGTNECQWYSPQCKDEPPKRESGPPPTSACGSCHQATDTEGETCIFNGRCVGEKKGKCVTPASSCAPSSMKCTTCNNADESRNGKSGVKASFFCAYETPSCPKESS